MPLNPADARPSTRSAREVDRLFPWLRKELIRGIPHFITPAWNQDRSRFDPEHYADCWKEIGFETIILLTNHHDGYSLFPSRHLRAQPERDYFGEQTAACRKRGIRVVAYYSLSLNSLVGSEHPEWRIRDVHDRVLLPDHRYFFHYHWLCVNSPYRDLVLAQFDELAGNYEIEGFFLDINYLPPHPPDVGLQEGQDTCFCAHCHRAYSQWFGGEHLIEAYGSARHDEFRAESYRRFLMDLKQGLKKHNRPLLVGFNGAGRYRHPFYERVDELADYHFSEAHSAEARCISARLSLERAYELASCSELVWSHNVSKPTTLLKLESLSVIIGGGAYVLGINHAPDGRLQEGNIQRLKEWGAWIRAHRDLLQGGVPLVEVAILEAGQICRPHHRATWVWAEWLRDMHFQFAIIREFDARKAPPVVIVPHGIHLTPKLLKALQDYVHTGGKLLIEGLAQQHNDDGPLMFGELTGCRWDGTLKGHGFYLLPEMASLKTDLLEGEPVYFECGKAHVLHCARANCLAHLVPQFKDKQRLSDIQTVPNYPARKDQVQWTTGVALNRVGKGRVMTCALQLTCPDEHQTRHPWPRQLAANLLNHLLGGQTVRIRGHEAVEVLVVRKGRILMLHLLNHLYDASKFITASGENLQLADLQIELGERFPEVRSAASMLPSGNALEIRKKDGKRVVLLKSLGLYQAVRVTT